MKVKKRGLLAVVLLTGIMMTGVLMAVHAEEDCPKGGNHVSGTPYFAYTIKSYPGPSHPRVVTETNSFTGETITYTVSCPTMVFIDEWKIKCTKCETVLASFTKTRTECECP